MIGLVDEAVRLRRSRNLRASCHERGSGKIGDRHFMTLDRAIEKVWEVNVVGGNVRLDPATDSVVAERETAWLLGRDEGAETLGDREQVKITSSSPSAQGQDDLRTAVEN